MASEHHDTEWHNPKNWRDGWLGIYVARRDPRLLVAARRRWLGLTPNFGRRGTWLLLGGVYVAMAGLVFLLWAWARTRAAP
jgi:uncharacterized membrane protein